MKKLIFSILFISSSVFAGGSQVGTLKVGSDSSTKLNLPSTFKQNDILAYQIKKQDGLVHFQTAELKQNAWEVKTWVGTELELSTDLVLKKALTDSNVLKNWQKIN
ncbi:MAG: hypothetical protein WA160_06880 [Pseudobdellovibrio sp.]